MVVEVFFKKPMAFQNRLASGFLEVSKYPIESFRWPCRKLNVTDITILTALKPANKSPLQITADMPHTDKISLLISEALRRHNPALTDLAKRITDAYRQGLLNTNELSLFFERLAKTEEQQGIFAQPYPRSKTMLLLERLPSTLRQKILTFTVQTRNFASRCRYDGLNVERDAVSTWIELRKYTVKDFAIFLYTPQIWPALFLSITPGGTQIVPAPPPEDPASERAIALDEFSETVDRADEHQLEMLRLQNPDNGMTVGAEAAYRDLVGPVQAHLAQTLNDYTGRKASDQDLTVFVRGWRLDSSGIEGGSSAEWDRINNLYTILIACSFVPGAPNWEQLWGSTEHELFHVIEYLLYGYDPRAAAVLYHALRNPHQSYPRYNEVFDDSNYLPGRSDYYGHPSDNEGETFASSRRAFYRNADELARNIQWTPNRHARAAQILAWCVMRQEAGRVFTASGEDPFARFSSEFIAGPTQSSDRMVLITPARRHLTFWATGGAVQNGMQTLAAALANVDYSGIPAF